MRNALAATLWLCVLAACAPTSLPDDLCGRRREWTLSILALVLAVVAMCVEAG